MASLWLSGSWSLQSPCRSPPCQTLVPDCKPLYLCWLSARFAPLPPPCPPSWHPSVIITSFQTAFQAATRGNYLQRPDLILTLAMALLSCSYSSAGSASPHLPLLLLSQHPPTPHRQPNQIRAMSKQHTSYVLDTLLTLTNSDPYNTILLLNWWGNWETERLRPQLVQFQCLCP